MMSPPHKCEMNGTSATDGGGLKRERHASDDGGGAPTAKAPKTHKSEEKSEHPPRPAPYFFYTDRSHVVDDDPLTPVTPPNVLPSFPIKMHAILSMPELSDVLAWDSHGRSFRILKPKQFERDVLPKYFDHSKFSSFTRQVNGWGFRRLAEGVNMGSYYEENFLRSMPWLVKNMKRPKVGEKKTRDANFEPDLAAISEKFPVPNHPITREIQVVMETINKGPKAKMPELMLLRADEVGQMAPSQGSIAVDNATMPVAQPLSQDSTALRTLLQSLQQNGFNHPMTALLNTPHQQVNAVPTAAARPTQSTAILNDVLVAQKPPAPAPSTDLLSNLLLHAIQQNINSGSMPQLPNTYQQPNSQASYQNIISSAASFASKPSFSSTASTLSLNQNFNQNARASALSDASTTSSTSSTMSLSQPNYIQQYLNQNALAGLLNNPNGFAAPAMNQNASAGYMKSLNSFTAPALNQNALANFAKCLNGLAAPSVQNSGNVHVGQGMRNTTQVLTESQLKGMSIDQLQLLLNLVNKS